MVKDNSDLHEPSTFYLNLRPDLDINDTVNEAELEDF
jgi:hypothetical protein